MVLAKVDLSAYLTPHLTLDTFCARHDESDLAEQFAEYADVDAVPAKWADKITEYVIARPS